MYRRLASWFLFLLLFAMGGPALANASGPNPAPQGSAGEVGPTLPVPPLPTAEQLNQLDDDSLAANQQEIDAVVEVLRGRGGEQLTGLQVDVVNRRIWTWWYSSVPDWVSEAPGSSGVVVSAGISKYSRALLKSESRDILLFLLKHAPEIAVAVVPEEDGSGLSLWVHAERIEPTRELLQSWVGSVDRSDISLEADSVGAPYAYRYTDTTRGGLGARVDSSGSFCSTAFSVLYGANGLLLSAAHCDVTGNSAWKTGNGLATLSPGQAYTSVILALDSLAMNATGGTSGSVYSAGYASPETLPVAGTATNNVGDIVCTSGGNSGRRCRLQVTNTSVSKVCVAGYSYICEMVRAVHLDAAAAIARGDSGGPVFRMNSGNASVTAKGVISQGNPNFWSCPINTYTETVLGWPDPGCSTYVDYLPIRVIEDAWNVVVEVG